MELTAGSAADIKAALPIVYVLDRWRVAVEDVGGRYAAVCPFHADSDPSLDVYGDRLERFGCFPCGAGGDVFDLIERLAWPGAFTVPPEHEHPAFRDVKALAQQLLAELEASDWSGPREGTSKVFNPELARMVVAQSSINQLDAVVSFLQAKWNRSELLAVDAGWLHERWGVGSRIEEIVIPYFNRHGELLTYKHRTAETKAMSAAGSALGGVLYGEWMDQLSRTVVLTEGETDAWAADRAAGDLYSVLGIPTGVGAHPKQAAMLAGRSVLIAFDGDVAGRDGALRWHQALTQVGAGVRIVPVPDDTDLAGLDPHELRSLLSR